MTADITKNKKLDLVETENLTFQFFITKSHFKVQKKLDYVLFTFLLWKFQVQESFNKSHLIIHQILTLKIL